MERINRFKMGFIISLAIHLLMAGLLAYAGVGSDNKASANVIGVEILNGENSHPSVSAVKSSASNSASKTTSAQNKFQIVQEKDSIVDETLQDKKKETPKEQEIQEKDAFVADSNDSGESVDNNSENETAVSDKGSEKGSEGLANAENDISRKGVPGNGSNAKGDSVDRSVGPSGSGSGRYDKAIVKKGIQGSVTIRALLGVNGTIQSAVIVTSSGYSAIDNMGMRDIYKRSYTPRRDKNGKPVACYITQTFSYLLK